MTEATGADWPLIRTAVDDYRRATPDEVRYCACCEGAYLKEDLAPWLGEMRCEECCWLCPVCRDREVAAEGEFCDVCALWALGVEV